MITKQSVRRWKYILTTLVAILMAAPGLHASLLWDNGTVGASTFRCDSGPGDCSGSGTWTVYDDFNLTAPATVTGFTYNDYVYGSIADYVSTSWSIWQGDPLSGGTLEASATGVAANPVLENSGPAAGTYMFTVSGLNVVLPSGTYFLGRTNVVTNSTFTDSAIASGNGLPGYEQSDGAAYKFYLNSTGNADTAFTIQGTTATPEPTTLGLVGLTLLPLLFRRRKA